MTKKFNLEETVYFPNKSVFLTGLDLDCVEIKQYFKEEEATFIMWFYPGEKAMGPPGHCHGGLTSAILDESMGSCCWLNAHLVMTVKLDVRYKSRIPICNEYIATARIKSAKGRRLVVGAEITDEKGKVYAVGEGTFLSVPIEKLASAPEYADHIEKAAEYFELRRQGKTIEDILRILT